MEDNDDFQPDESGSLDLKYRGWASIHHNLWSFSTSLVHLDLSFNSLSSLPEEELPELRTLETFNIACNNLTTLPESIGALERLTVLKANGNALTHIPATIGRCVNLEELNVSENSLTVVPHEIEGCTRLRTILLQNNQLVRLPPSIASLEGTLRTLDLSNNHTDLDRVVPREVHRDAASILWILTTQRGDMHRLDETKGEVKNLLRDVASSEEELVEARRRLVSLEGRKKELDDDFEKVRYYLVLRTRTRALGRRFDRWVDASKRAFANRIR